MSSPLHLDPSTTRPSSPLLSEGPLPLLIGGEWVQAASGETFETIDPTTGEALTQVALAGAEDVDRAVAAARRAFKDPSWSAITPQRRTEILLQLADVVEEHAEELAILDSRDMGAPLTVARWMVDEMVTVLRHNAGWPTKLYGQTAPSKPNQFHYVLRQPLGVVAGITGWNGPFLQFIWKLAPALATGNTFVMKPPAWAPLSALRFGQLAAKTDLPPGVLNIIPGSGSVTGEALIAHPGVDKISFTGSTAVGQRILQVASQDLKKVTLELGGKSPTIVFDDADLEAAAKMAAAAFNLGSGEACVAGSRIFVQETVKDRFRELLIAAMDNFSAGDPFHPDTQMGPLATREHFDRVAGYVELAREEGATVTTGGGWEPHDLFMPPTLLEDVRSDMRCVREEIFGPVASLMTFTDIDDAIAQGNDTPYGLSASVWTRDYARTNRMVTELQVGTVWVNTYGDMSSGTVPFGGFKMSGSGREHGTQVLDAYTETKTVMIEIAGG